MSLLKLPEPKALSVPEGISWDAPSDIVARWAATPVAAADDEPDTISIYDFIGEDPWTGAGVTAKRISAALRAIGATKDVRVKINSPGGSLPEGTAIFNELRQHQGKVIVDVMGWAASAASVIAMAGDEIRMGLGSFMFVHRAWGLAIGNTHVFAEASALFKEFDASMVDIYAARTKRERGDIDALLDGSSKASDGTFMSATRAVEEGFATEVDDSLGIEESDSPEARAVKARRKMEGFLARAGVTRKDRSALIDELLASASPDSAAVRDAGRSAPRDAGAFAAALGRLHSTIQGTKL